MRLLERRSLIHGSPSGADLEKSYASYLYAAQFFCPA
jgi:hypothetical protein